MFFEKAFRGKNHWWRYIVVTIVVAIGYGIGQLPLSLALYRSITDNPELTTEDLQAFQENPDFSIYGINPNMGFALLLMMFLGAFAAFYFIYKPLHNREFKSLVNPFSKIRWNRVFLGFGIWLTMTVILEIVGYFLDPGNYTFQFKFNTFIPLALISLLVLPIQTSTEELFFRGYLMQGIGTSPLYKIIAVLIAIGVAYTFFSFGSGMDLMQSGTEATDIRVAMLSSGLMLVTILVLFLVSFLLIKLMNGLSIPKDSILNKNTKWLPLIITSILFGLIHSMNPEIEKFGFAIMQTYYICAGLVLGVMTIMDDGLELALGVHAATNFSGAVFVGYSGAAIQTDALFKTTEVNPVLLIIFFIIMSICFLLYMKYRYQWGSFATIFSSIEDPDKITLNNENYNTL